MLTLSLMMLGTVIGTVLSIAIIYLFDSDDDLETIGNDDL